MANSTPKAAPKGAKPARSPAPVPAPAPAVQAPGAMSAPRFTAWPIVAIVAGGPAGAPGGARRDSGRGHHPGRRRQENRPDGDAAQTDPGACAGGWSLAARAARRKRALPRRDARPGNRRSDSVTLELRL